MHRIRSCFVLAMLIAALLLPVLAAPAADTLPAQLADDAFWKVIDGASEPSGEFQSENFLSNETGFQGVIPALLKIAKPGGVYMGVGPEQNFTYITAIRPKMAFIVDIRRQNMLEHMIYRAAFELSVDRADFLSRLFSRKRPAGLSDKSKPDELFAAYLTAPADDEAYAKNLREIKDLLLQKHKFGLTREDETNIEHVYTVFRNYGPEINYSSGANGRAGAGGGMPNYTTLMTATDGQGAQRSYLANEENYRFIRDLEMRNMLVPLTGDFGGSKALSAVAQYLKDHGATVTAFYLSNVEQYLFQSGRNLNGGAGNFYENVAALPLDSFSTFIRSGNGGRGGGGAGGAPGGMGSSVLASMQETLAAVKDNRIRQYNDVFAIAPPLIVYSVGQSRVTAPQLRSQVTPLYTVDGRRLKIEGTVLLEIIVRNDGTVDSNVVLRRGLGYGLDENAIEAVRQWRFNPGTMDNMPVNVRVTIEVQFRLV